MDNKNIENAINETIADIEKYLKKGEFEMMARLKAWNFIEAIEHQGGRVIFEALDGGVQIEMNCNKALMTVIMMNMLERYGIEEFIELEAVRRMTGTIFEKKEKAFDTPEEMEVFKKMRNMSAQDIEKLKNEK